MSAYTASGNNSTTDCFLLKKFWSSTMRDQGSNMVLRGVFLLSLLITQVLSAPSGCLESCNSYVRQYQTQSGSFQDHTDLLQSASRLQNLDYSRPGTWSEHNNFNVDNGHGKVHEEHGQIVDGPKTVRYYKKNYSSSYSTGYSNGARQTDSNNNYGHDVFNVPTTDHLNSQTTYGQAGNSESLTQHEYNRRHNQQYTQQSALRRTNARSERLEDFGEYSGNSQVTQQGASGLNTQTAQTPYYPETQHGNWSTVDSYKTDGGRGRVFEEEGQFVTGGKKVRYVKRNYTSSHTTVGGIPIPDIAITGVHDLHKEIEKIQREIGTEYNQISTKRNTASSNALQQSMTQHLTTDELPLSVDSLHNANSDVYNSQINRGNIYRNPSQNAYGTNSYSMYERHEGHVTNIQPSTQYVLPIPEHTSVLNTEHSGHNRHAFNEGSMRQRMENLQQTELLNSHQSRLTQNQMVDDSFRRNVFNQNSGTYLGTPGTVQHYNEHWSASQTRESSVPNYNSDTMHNMQEQSRYSQQYRESAYNSGHRTKLGKLVTGTLDLGQGIDTVDCEQTKYKRDIKNNQSSETQQQSEATEDIQQTTGHLGFGQESEDLAQQTSGKLKLGQQSEDLTQQTNQFDDQQASGKLELGQHSQQIFYPWGPDSANQHSEDFTKQIGQSDDLTQQTSGKLELGQQTYQPWKPGSADEQSEDLTQQTGQSDDLTQQTSGKLELGQQTYQPWKPGSADQQFEDLTQQTGQSDDLTQQTSGKLELGHQAYQPWKPGSADQQSEDLTQQTGQYDDLTQQTSGKLELGQQTYQPWKPGSADQQFEDLTQQTGQSDDLTQQTSGKLELGQQSYQPWKPGSADQQSEDLTQQTGQYDDLTQQTSGKLELGQRTYQPWKPGSADQQSEDLTQQTGQYDDLTQQTSGKLELGQQTYQPWKPGSADQQSEDLTQQTGQSDDLTQQTSGKLELGQQTYQPWKPGSADQQSEDLTHQTGQSDDLTQQTSGKLELGQQTYQPWKPGNADQQSEDLTQQTGQSDDLTQQTSGKLKLGQQSEDLTQQTNQFDDQQASGKLELGQNSQQIFYLWGPNSANQHSEDFTQQIGQSDDLTQQTSGKLELGQQTYQPWKPGSADQQSEDLIQQTGQYDDLTQQTSGKLELGQQTYQPWKPGSADQQSEDLTQQTGQYDDLTQQTSGKLELGQQTYQPWKPGSADQQSEDLTQQTGQYDDLTQQTSGKLELGQQTYQPWKPGSADQQSEDLTQQTGQSDDLTQQTSGKLELGQQTYQPWKPGSADQQSEDLTQQTGQYDDLTQQTSGKLELGQQTYQPWRLGSADQHSEDMTQKTSGNLELEEKESVTHLPKPASKPKLRPRYQRIGLSNSAQMQDLNPSVIIRQNSERGSYINNVGNQNIRGDQSADNSTDQQIGGSGFEIEGESDQGNLLHKSNDATVGLSWHYTYHPSDQRQFVSQTDEKDKDALQKQSSKIEFSPSEDRFDQQETQNKYSDKDEYQQSSNSNIFNSQYNQEFTPSQQSENYELGQRTEKLQDIQKEGQLEFVQQTTHETKDQQKQVQGSEVKNQLEPRILEAYGGGPYDAFHGDDIYTGVRVNPSATLPPINGADPWDIREKPRVMPDRPEEVTPEPSPVIPLTTPPETTAPPSFWSRVGNRLTNTFDKAKEKARNIFG